jgi:proteasome maturation protein
MLSSSAHPVGGSHNLALEILSGSDETLDAQDFMGGDRLLGEVVDVTSAMERSRGI